MLRAPYFFVPFLSPPYRAVRRRLRFWLYRGDAVRCVVCGHGFRAWFAGDPPDVCPYCGSQTRHKFAALYLKDYAPPEGRTARLLMFAPDFGLEKLLKRSGKFDVVTTDYSAPGVDHHWDIRALDAPDDAFDVIMCSHVLEHVPEDAKALSELHRVAAPDGLVMIQVPFDRDRACTDEDFSDLSTEERIRRFGQHDHVRLYGRDLIDRIRAAGFNVDQWKPAETMSDAEKARLGVWDDIVFLCRPRKP